MRLCVGCFEDRFLSLVQSHFQKMYTVEYAKTGRAGCKLCTGKIGKGELRIGKQVLMTQFPHASSPRCQIQVERGDFLGTGIGWFHFPCFWEQGPSFKVSRYVFCPLSKACCELQLVIYDLTGFGQTSRASHSFG